MGRNTRHTLTYGYDEATVGSHAGISDTSQMLFIRPTGVRRDQIKPWGGRERQLQLQDGRQGLSDHGLAGFRQRRPASGVVYVGDVQLSN